MPGRLSLRARLLLGVIVLTAIGLGGANVATYASLRAFLLDRTDESLQDSHFGIERAVHGNCGRGGGSPLPGASPGDFIQLRDAEGTVLCSLQTSRFGDDTLPRPHLPAEIDVPAGGEGPQQARYFTVDAVS